MAFRNLVSAEADKLLDSIPGNRFVTIDGQIYLMLTPKELVEYSYGLLDAHAIVDLGGKKGTENATDDKGRVKEGS